MNSYSSFSQEIRELSFQSSSLGAILLILWLYFLNSGEIGCLMSCLRIAFEPNDIFHITIWLFGLLCCLLSPEHGLCSSTGCLLPSFRHCLLKSPFRQVRQISFFYHSNPSPCLSVNDCKQIMAYSSPYSHHTSCTRNQTVTRKIVFSLRRLKQPFL